jgi:hypothetical protein
MINFNFSIANPFRYKEFRTVWNRAWAVNQHRTLEVQIYRYSYNLFEFSIDLRWWGTSHAGPRLELGILGWTVDISLPSNYHWNSETQDWVKHD